MTRANACKYYCCLLLLLLLHECKLNWVETLSGFWVEPSVVQNWNLTSVWLTYIHTLASVRVRGALIKLIQSNTKPIRIQFVFVPACLRVCVCVCIVRMPNDGNSNTNVAERNTYTRTGTHTHVHSHSQKRALMPLNSSHGRVCVWIHSYVFSQTPF